MTESRKCPLPISSAGAITLSSFSHFYFSSDFSVCYSRGLYSAKSLGTWIGVPFSGSGTAIVGFGVMNLPFYYFKLFYRLWGFFDWRGGWPGLWVLGIISVGWAVTRSGIIKSADVCSIDGVRSLVRSLLGFSLSLFLSGEAAADPGRLEPIAGSAPLSRGKAGLTAPIALVLA